MEIEGNDSAPIAAPELATDARPNLVRRSIKWLQDFLASTLVLLIAAWIFENVAGERLDGGIAAAVDLQTHLVASVATLDPTHFLRYFSDTFDAIYRTLGNVSGSFAGSNKFVDLGISILTLIALPVAVFVEGDAFERVLVLAVYVPSAVAMHRAYRNEKGVFPGASLFLAFGFTVVVYWCVHLLLSATLALFGEFIVLARLAVGTGFTATGLYWALSKRGEHSLTEIALHALIRREG